MIPELVEEFPELSKVQICRALGISRAEMYRKRAAETDSLVKSIEKIVSTFLGYGYRRVYKTLRKEGMVTSEYAVRRAMRENGLSKRKRRPKGITKKDPKASRYENLLRQFEPTKQDEIWAADMTVVRTRSGACYLAVIIDLFSRKAVAWHISRSPDLNLALACLKKALSSREPVKGWIHHSDQGSVYTAPAYMEMVRSAGGRMSMSRTGTPTDNAFAESFFATLKKEEVHPKKYDSFTEMETSLQWFIETLYNGSRMHSSIGDLSPDEFEARSREAGA